ncbi:MAG: hypothetical protein OEZ43_21515 [Gammaproteobacteria bacterium]|nr:hypothetical protein [Gammaproteobacteria bacterium]
MSKRHILLSFIFISPLSASAVPVFNITDLGTLGGNYSYAEGVNNSGQVVGYSGTGDGKQRAFITNSQGQMVEAGPLNNLVHSRAYAVNDSGVIAGYAYNSYDNYALIGESGNFSSVSGLENTPSIATGINNSGQTTGYFVDGFNARAYISDATNGFVDLGHLGGGESTGRDINEDGTVTGYSWMANGDVHAFVYDTQNLMQDLGTLGGKYAYSYAINDSGKIAGFSRIASNNDIQHAFVGDALGGLMDLGTLGGDHSSALGINNDGIVVGASSTQSGEFHAMYWDPMEGMFDLNEMVLDLVGWQYLHVSTGISDTGYITGWGVVDSGERHAFLLSKASVNIPEPPSYVLFLFGIVGMCRTAFKRTKQKTKYSRLSKQIQF